MNNVIEFADVVKSFRKKIVLCGVSCKLENGIYGLLGPNGAGKTTLMRCITKLYPYQGEIMLNGNDIKKQSADVGYLPQKFGVFPELTVEQLLQYFCNMKGIRKEARDDMITKSLEKVNLLDARKVVSGKLSGGMLRRLGIAQAILGNPALILLDEPTAGLDPEERMRFKNIITGLAGECIVMISTHIVEDVEACCDHILVMNKGRMLCKGTVLDIQGIADGKILELDEEECGREDVLFVEKSYIRNGMKKYRTIMKKEVEGALTPTVEDGYLCLLKEN